ncbi:hypothetical protein TRVL_07347 [Trypanosoma vivax]|nr:hypothetical protein TRVL_07347 [Trypanosoma vivax]
MSQHVEGGVIVANKVVSVLEKPHQCSETLHETVASNCVPLRMRAAHLISPFVPIYRNSCDASVLFSPSCTTGGKDHVADTTQLLKDKAKVSASAAPLIVMERRLLSVRRNDQVVRARKIGASRCCGAANLFR